MKQLEKINTPYLWVPALGLVASFIWLTTFRFIDIKQTLMYIGLIVLVLALSGLFSKNRYLLSKAVQLQKRCLVYMGLALVIGAISVLLGVGNPAGGLTLEFVLYILCRSLFYAFVLYLYYYIENELKIVKYGL